MEILQDIGDRGYPTEYLLSRIRGRRVFLLRDWDKMLFAPDVSEYLMSTHYGEFISAYPAEGIRKRYLKELRWVYHQTNATLRHAFRPFFMYSELNTLLVCLRYLSGKGNRTEIERILAFSLLSDKIKLILMLEADISYILEDLEKKLTCLSVNLSDVFMKDGLIGVERATTRSMLEHIMIREIHPAIKQFFISVIDSINIVTVYKHLKWGLTTAPVLIEGGVIKKSSLDKVMLSREISGVSELVYKKTGLQFDEQMSSAIESSLGKGITKQLKMLEREYPDIGLILNYLWRFSIEVKNLAIISYGNKVDKTIIKEELVNFT